MQSGSRSSALLGLLALLLSVVSSGACASDNGPDSTPSATASVLAAGTASAPTATATRTAGPTEVSTTAPSSTATPTEPPSPEPEPTVATPPIEEITATAAASPPPAATPTSAPVVLDAPDGVDIRATRLRIPSLGIDSEVHGSQEVPDTSPMPPGCPAKPPGQTTLTVPQQGIATPEESFAGLERKSWIYGHSRWQGEPGLFFALQHLAPGDELFIDGVERSSGEVVTGHRFVIDGLFLADTVSGGNLVTAEQSTPTSQVILQTSVRGRGEGQAWILDRETLLRKSVNVVEGDLEDPCKYLLLFVIASAS